MAIIVNKTAPSLLICPRELLKTINNDPIIISLCESITVDNEVEIELTFSVALSPTEDAQLDSIISTFVCPPGSTGVDGEIDEGAGLVILNDEIPLISDVQSIDFKGSVAANSGGSSTATVHVGHVEVRNNSGVSITKGSPVYISGYDPVTKESLIGLAKASDQLTLPAIGLVKTTLADGESGLVTLSGEADGLDTSSWSVGDPLYVSTTGGLTTTKPITATNLIQKVGLVAVSDMTNGVVFVIGAGRTNDIPNLLLDNVWMGNANDVPTPTPISTLVGYFGLEFAEAESEHESSTTSRTYQTKVKLITGTLPSGNYRIGWSCEIQSSHYRKIIEVKIDCNGTILGNPQIVAIYNNAWIPLSGFRYLTTSGIQTITIYWRRNGSAHNAKIRKARLEIWRID